MKQNIKTHQCKLLSALCLAGSLLPGMAMANTVLIQNHASQVASIQYRICHGGQFMPKVICSKLHQVAVKADSHVRMNLPTRYPFVGLHVQSLTMNGKLIQYHEKGVFLPADAVTSHQVPQANMSITAIIGNIHTQYHGVISSVCNDGQCHEIG